MGVYDFIVNVGEFLNTQKLYESKDELLELLQVNAELHRRASRYITAAGALLADSYRIALQCTDSDKVLRCAASLCKKEFPSGEKRKKAGREQTIYLSGVTPRGVLFLEDTLNLLAQKVYVIEDQYGAAGRMLLSAIRAFALDNGYDLITCPCPMAPKEKIDHIIIPELSLAFSTSNGYHALSDYHQRIHARRFTETAALRSKKQHLSFNKKAAHELLTGAGHILAQAKEVHDEIEVYYIEAMDFSKVDALAETLVQRIAALSSGLLF